MEGLRLRVAWIEATAMLKRLSFRVEALEQGSRMKEEEAKLRSSDT